MNSVNALLEEPFSSHAIEDQVEIKILGRPLPDLNIQCRQSTNKHERIRKFSREIYDKSSWICGCNIKNALFCFPCVLFGGESPWTKTGVTDLAHIWSKIKTHEKSKQHVNNIFSYSLIGKRNIQDQLTAAYREKFAQHNRLVEINRYVLNLIINSIISQARELDEAEEYQNKGLFRGLANFSSELDRDLKEELNKSPIFKGSSLRILNDLLDCMLQVYRNEIIIEIQNTNHVAVIVEEIIDSSDELRLVLILRYIVGDKPVERFINFLQPDGYDVASISRCILGHLHPFLSNTPNKLIAFSYQGGVGVSGDLNGVLNNIKETYKLANLVHCYTQDINLAMANAAECNTSARIFFANLLGICSFFSNARERTQILDEIVNGSLSQPLHIIWNFNFYGINLIYENRKDLITVMEKIEYSDFAQNATIIQAGAFKYVLQSIDFVFWLAFFYKIMPHLESIFDHFVKKNTDQQKVQQDLQTFEKVVQEIRDELDTFIEEVQEEDYELRPIKRARYSENIKKKALEVCDSVMQQINARFSFTGHLVATNLLMSENFKKYEKKFPQNFLDEVTASYPFLDKSRLRTELEVLYARPELRQVFEAIPLLSFILRNELKESFQVTLNLLMILVTTPMATSEKERCFSTLKCMKTFLMNTVNGERLSALGMLWVSKGFLTKINVFNKKVIDLFASKEGRSVDFTYR